MSSDDPQMQRKKMWVEWKDGADLSQSRKKPGDRSPLTRDRDGNLGQVTLREIEDDEDSGWSPEPWTDDGSSPLNPLAAALVEIAAEVLPQLVELAYAGAKPHVRRWWDDTARPALSSRRDAASSRLAAPRPGRNGRHTGQAVSLDARQPSNALEPERQVMSSNEAQQRLAAALIARAFSDRQIETLLNARIESGDELPQENLLQQVPPEVIEHHVTRMLEANSSLHEDLLNVFWSDQAGGGSALPLPIERVGSEQVPLDDD